MNEALKIITGILIGIFTLVIAISTIATYVVFKSTEDPKKEVEVLYIEKADTLNEWQVFQMALIEVESEYKSDAVSHCNARGILQLTKVYVDEVNRIHETEYTEHDAHNDTTALLLFYAFNYKHNPEFDINTAIRQHNPNAGAWYEKRVKDKMNEIRRREQIRRLIINQ